MADQLTNEEIAKQLADLKAANEKLAADNQTISGENQKLIKALSAQTTVDVTPTSAKAVPKIPTQRVKYGEAEYAFQVPTFYHNGYYLTAEEIVADQNSREAKETIAGLIAMPGQGILKEVK